MADLVPQLIDIPIVGGVDEKTDDKVSLRWSVSKNVSRPKLGGITRRNSGGWLANQFAEAPRRMLSLGAVPAIMVESGYNGPFVLSYLPGLTNPSPRFSSGPSLRTLVSDHWTESIPIGFADSSAVDSAYTFFPSSSGKIGIGQLSVSISTESGVQFCFQQYEAGSDPTDLSNATLAGLSFVGNFSTFNAARIFAKATAGTTGIIAGVYFLSGSASSKIFGYYPATSQINNTATLTADAFSICDGRVSPDNTSLIFAYVKNATTITVQKWTLSTMTLAATLTITTASAATALCVVESDQDLLRVMWSETTSQTVRQATSTISTFAAFTTQATASAAGTSIVQIAAAENSTFTGAPGMGTVWITDVVSAGTNPVVRCATYVANTLNSMPPSWTGTGTNFCRMVSKPFAERGGTYVLLVSSPTSTQATYFLTQINQISAVSIQFVGKTMYAVASSLAAASGLTCCQPIPTYSYPTPNSAPSGMQSAAMQTVEIPSASTFRKTPKLLRWMIDPLFLGSEKFGLSQVLAGGALYQHDNIGAAEVSFFLAPELSSIAAAGAAGFLSAGQYSVIAVFSAIDSHGQTIRSAPSLPLTVTASALNTITVNVTNLMATLRWNGTTTTQQTSLQPISIELYRTVANGSTYYRDTSIALANNTFQLTSGLSSLSSSVADSTIQSQQIGYWQGSLNSYSPDGTGVIGSALGRIWCADPLDPDIYRWSQSAIQGQALSFAAEFAARLPPGSTVGRITAFAGMDDKCIISKRRGLWCVSGDGPTANGTGAFSNPINIAKDIGILNSKAWALIPAGIVFISEKGVWLLGRDLSLTYIGKDIENYFFDYPSSDPALFPSGEARAMLVEDQNQVRFIFRSASISTRPSLIAVYDYEQKTWDYHEPMARSDLTKTFVVSDLLSVNGQIYQSQMATDGTAETLCVAQERYDYLPETTTAANIPGVGLVSSWIKAAGMQGFEKLLSLLFLLKTVIANSTYPTIPADWTLTVSIAYDYDPTIRETHTITYANMVNGGLTPQFRIDASAQGYTRCQSFQITITESFPTTAAGFLWQLDSIQALIGVLPGGARLPSAKRA